MATKDTKKVTAHYRRMIYRVRTTATFRELFEEALKFNQDGHVLGEHAGARKWRSPEGTEMCLLEYKLGKSELSFGALAIFRDGDVPVVQESEDGDELATRTIELDDKVYALKGVTYFVSRGNNFAVLNNDSNTRYLVEYLHWLLRKPVGPLAADEGIEFGPIVSAEGKAIAINSIKSIKVRAEVQNIETISDTVQLPDVTKERSFARLIDRQQFTLDGFRRLLGEFGLTHGSLARLENADLENLEIELLIRKKERGRIQPIPDEIVSGLISDGLDRAAELTSEGARRQGDALVLSYPGDIITAGPHFDVKSVKRFLVAALQNWENQGLI